jgi:hypothetical protein
MTRDIGREEQREGVEKDPVDRDKASWKHNINVSPSTPLAEELDEPSMAPKRKESAPKSACCISEIRVFLHEYDQHGTQMVTDIPEHT